MIARDSWVALAHDPKFTGVVQRDEDGLFTVEFVCGGRGWLRSTHLIEIPNPEGTTTMDVGDKVALRDHPELTGTINAIDREDGMANVTEDGGNHARQQIPVADLIQVNDIELPDSNKAWPPPGMETKSGT